MKKHIRNIAFAIAIMGLAVACNNNPAPEEEPIDTIDTMVEEMVEDTTPAVVVEEPVKKAAPAKKAVKKDEPKVGENITKEDGITISTSAGSLKMGAKDGKLTGETKVTTNDGTTIQTNNMGGLKKKKTN